MGNQNSSKREYRKDNMKLFKSLIKKYQENENINPIGSNFSTDFLLKEKKMDDEDFLPNQIECFIRKRPIFQHELKNREYDVISCDDDGNIIVHDGRMAADMKEEHAFCDSFKFKFKNGHVFNEFNNTDSVYSRSLKPLLSLSCKKGFISTCFMFGQTGSGKTYTITGCVNRMAKDLFSFISENSKKITVVCSAHEMIGDGVFDLFNKHKKVQLLEGQNGVTLKGSKELVCQTAAQIIYLYKFAANERETAATKVNATSSRSHYIFKVFLKDSKNRDYGKLNLIDLAGSERNADSMYHNAERRRECAQINSSLMCLKNVMRLVAENKKTGQKQHVPFRDSPLTRLLKECFVDSSQINGKKSKLVVISTVSPCPTDTEHSINTLKHVCLMMHNNDEKKCISVKRYVAQDYLKDNSDSKKINVKEVRKWNSEEVFFWLSNVKKGRFKKYVKLFPKTVDGKQLMRYTPVRLKQIVGDANIGQSIRDSLVKEMDKISKIRMKNAAAQRNLLKKGQGMKYS